MNEYEKMWWGICENGKCSVWRSSLWTQHHCPMALWSWYDLTHTVVLPTLSSGFWIQWIGPWETKDLLGLEWMMHKKQNQYHFLNINYFLWRMIMCVLIQSHRIIFNCLTVFNECLLNSKNKTCDGYFDSSFKIIQTCKTILKL